MAALDQQEDRAAAAADIPPDPERVGLRLGGLPHEVFQVAYLNTSYKRFRDRVETLEEGVQDRAAVYPSKVMAAALRRGAATVVFAHNHPNGDARPSEQDKVLTRARAYFDNDEIRLLVGCLALVFGYYGERRGALLGSPLLELAAYVDGCLVELARRCAPPHPLTTAL